VPPPQANGVALLPGASMVSGLFARAARRRRVRSRTLAVRMNAPYNPYAAPLPVEPVGNVQVTGAPQGLWLKWPCAMAVPVVAVLHGLTYVGPMFGLDRTVAAIAALVNLVVLFGMGVFAMSWLGFAWSDVPPALRGGLSPLGAVGRTFIPLYGIYWMFKMVDRLCGALDVLLGHGGIALGTPKDIGRAAAGATIGSTVAMNSYPTVGWLVAVAGHVLWFVYMYRCDAVRRALAGTGGPVPLQPAPSWGAPPGYG
jgi:hypothetical protein